jgi:Cysteine-rich CPCC
MKYACPCCGHKTFSQPPNGTYDLCEVCFWEDDGIQFEDPNYEGGANRVSLRQAQKNYLKFGACEEEAIPSVRPATNDEPMDEIWKPLD